MMKEVTSKYSQRGYKSRSQRSGFLGSFCTLEKCKQLLAAPNCTH